MTILKIVAVIVLALCVCYVAWMLNSMFAERNRQDQIDKAVAEAFEKATEQKGV